VHVQVRGLREGELFRRTSTGRLLDLVMLLHGDLPTPPKLTIETRVADVPALSLRLSQPERPRFEGEPEASKTSS
jgi:hypothetical protein